MKKYTTLLFLLITSSSTFSQIKESITNDCKSKADASTIQNRFDLPNVSGLVFENARALTELNDNYADASPWISPDGLRLYFLKSGNTTWTRIYFSERPDTNSNFSTPVLAPLNIEYAGTIWFSDDELDLYVTSSPFLYYFHRATINSSFGPRVMINLNLIGGSSIKGISLNQDQSILFLSIATPGENWKIAQYHRTSLTDFAFDYTVTFDFPNNVGGGQLSKDNLQYFFGMDDHTVVENTKICRLTRSTTSEPFDGSSIEVIDSLNKFWLLNKKPTMSANLDWVVFERNVQYDWTGNDLYIAHRGDPLAVNNPSGITSDFSLFPVPSTGIINVHTHPNIDLSNATIEVYNALGQRIMLCDFTSQLDLTGNPKGFYSVKIEANGISAVQKIILQ